MKNSSDDPIFTNSKIYRDIAVQALAASDSAPSQCSRAKDDGSPGNVLTYDPGYRSFKQSMIAIVFAGMYIEAQLWVHGCSKLGSDEYRKIDKQLLEMRLPALGVQDQILRALEFPEGVWLDVFHLVIRKRPKRLFD